MVSILPTSWTGLLSTAVLLWASTAVPAGATVPASPSTATPLDPAWVRSIEETSSRLARQAFQERLGPQADVDVDIVVGRLDPRLRLAPCQKTALGFEGAYRPWGQTRITLRCLQGPVNWRLFVPLTVKVMAPALGLGMGLPSGTVLRNDHLTWVQVDWADSKGPWLLEAQALVGRPLKQAVAAGQALRVADLQPRVWFESGETVQLHVLGSGFRVQGQGVALGRGVENGAVRVRLENGKTLVGTATGLRQVSVQL